jgi:sulfite dehydrogenase (quinone) subunit SoeB
MVADRGGIALMPEQGTRPVNRYLPPREKGEIDILAPSSRRWPRRPGLLAWLDRTLERLG